ncbi:uncharacterized protein N7482_007345 [Penicillium canariense]|uniref:Homeobox domain-containing protein n=1 Tax=Penicillium canariense TaxID=189055 RepID=A0A9W9HZ93_9EURO|nr:uncharacterized protein N7482_007345 [Penicillium canariense]KAJ5160341.1 hypothetical protein N7482_007345 [Penicillium canariense]
MSYIHPSWNYPAHSGLPMDHTLAYDPTMVPPPMMHHPIDGYLYPHPPMEMLDYYHQPIMDYDEYTENLSRPRLTKEQVETLEAQFQAHPKPSSNVKRQLAAQTNLSLPRVANWFQNRRAKAKQQKRQEEFEKMQKAKAEAEETARKKSETIDQLSESRQASASQEEPERSPTPKQETTTTTTTSTAATSTFEDSNDDAKSKKHHKTKSESARDATFASLQRALNAACAARDRFTGRRGSKHESTPEEEPVSPTSMAPPSKASKAQENKIQVAAYSTGYSDWHNSEESASWASPHGQSETNSCQAPPAAPSSSHSVQQNVDAFSGAQFRPHNEEWAKHSKDQLSVHGMGPDANLGYNNNMQYPMALQTPDISMIRRESSGALTSLDGIGIHTGESGMPQSTGRVGESSWKEAGKELDLAARRKRPRPAAIGTSNTRSLAVSTSMSSLSPTSRIPSSAGAGNSMRHSKSTQSLNSRYAGVRKASAAHRSPLNFTFAESGSMKASKAEMLRPSVSSTTLAPPTPLTPQDFQHFMPASPTDSNYCLSAHSTTQFLPSSQPMQVNIASPPTTPLDIYSPFAYQHVGPPMSAPAQVSTFPEYVSCEPVPMTARSWADTGSLSSPDFQSGLQVPHSSTVSPIGFEAVVDHPGHAFGMESVSGSPSLIYSIEDTDLQGSADTGERKQAEFMMHDYSEQQDPRFSAHHMAHKTKGYTFANNTTPSNYPS